VSPAAIRGATNSLGILLLVTAVLSGCCRSFDSTTKDNDTAAREWIRDWRGQMDWKQISTWRNVSKTKLAQAEQLLRHTASVQVPEEKALDLINDPNFRVSPGRPYLFRAVGDAKDYWPQEVSIGPQGEIWIGGGANSRCAVAMHRRAVVVWLDQ